MELIIGGAFQGKTAFAKENFNISDEEIFVCDKDSAPEFDKKCISHIERFSFWCVEHGFEPADYFFEHVENIEDKIIISVRKCFLGTITIVHRFTKLNTT